MVIYTYKNCSSCRKATQWLRAHGIEYTEKAIRETPPSRLDLGAMLEYQAGSLNKLFNTAGSDYRELKMKERLPGMRAADALQMLSERGNLIKRPFLLGDDFGMVGFKEVDWAAQFGK